MGQLDMADQGAQPSIDPAADTGASLNGAAPSSAAPNGAPDHGGQFHDWPYVLKPRWIHDLLLLWRRKLPYEIYLERVADYSVREVRDQAMRQQCVAWLARHFAPSRASLTLTQNVWASYSHHFRARDLAAAFLVHLIANEPLARHATAALHEQVTPGMAIGRGHFGSVPAAPGALDAWLRTLQQWDVLVPDPRQGGYLLDKRIALPVQIFPLLVWVWWLDTKQASVPLDEFAALPLWTWVATDGFEAGWRKYGGRLWAVEQDGGATTVFLQPTDAAAFTRALLNLLSTDGRSGRQWPRRDEPSEEAFDEAVDGAYMPHVNAKEMRQSILGR